MSSGQTHIQQRCNGSRDQIQSQPHSHILTIMFPLGTSVSNTSIILQGNGNCPSLFDGDISLRDGGAIRKCHTYIKFINIFKNLNKFNV